MPVVLNATLTLDPNNQIAHLADFTGLVVEQEYLISAAFLQADTRFHFLGYFDIALSRPPLNVPAAQTEVAATISTVPTPAAATPPARYPYALNDRLMAGNLNLAFEMDPLATPPAGNGGGAGKFRYWVDTTGGAAWLRQAAQIATAGVYVPAEWVTWGSYDLSGTPKKFNFDGNNIGFANQLVVNGSLTVTGAINAPTLPYVRLTGDTMTGGLAVNSTAGITTTGSVNASSGTVTASILQIPNTTINNNGISTTSITASGNISGNTITGSAVNSSGGMTASGTVTAAALQIPNTTINSGGISTSSITAGGTVTAVTVNASGNITAVSNVTAAAFACTNVTINNTGIGTTNLTVSGQAQFNGGVTVTGSGGIYSAVGFSTNDGPGGSNLKLFASGGNSILNWAQSHYFVYEGPTQQVSYVAQVGQMWGMRPSDGLCYAARGPVAGVGAYINNSDRRFKEDIQPTTRGLDEILKLVPVEFNRADYLKLSERPKELGFVAQDVALVVPEAVWPVGMELPDGTGGLSDSEPTLGVTGETLVVCLVNAVKTLHERLLAVGG
jgi:hypothetical protein